MQNRLKLIYLNIRVGIHIPALIFHELCHLLFIAIFVCTVTKIEIIYPKKDKINYGMAISYNALDPLSALIISIAPLIGYFSLVIFLALPILNVHLRVGLLIYILNCRETFMLSNLDIECHNWAINEIKNKYGNKTSNSLAVRLKSKKR